VYDDTALHDMRSPKLLVLWCFWLTGCGARGEAELETSSRHQPSASAQERPGAADAPPRASSAAPPAPPASSVVDAARVTSARACDGCCARDADGRCLDACTLNGPDAPVATPFGERPLRSLFLGSEVWTYDRGRVVAARVIATERLAAPPVDFLRVTVRSGESFLTLPGHPLPDGGCFAELAQLLGAGMRLPAPYFGVATIESAGPAEGRVYDLLPDGDTGIYWVKGVPVASSIRRPAVPIEVDIVPVPGAGPDSL
jgi:hypothetical protein